MSVNVTDDPDFDMVRLPCVRVSQADPSDPSVVTKDCFLCKLPIDLLGNNDKQTTYESIVHKLRFELLGRGGVRDYR